jgi:hypothetical protein
MIEGNRCHTQIDLTAEPQRLHRTRLNAASTISGRGLNTSANLGTYIPTLSTPSITAVVRCLFFREASCLDAFSSYPPSLSYSALPCRTTDTPEATIPRSSRTRGTFRSGINALPAKSNKPVSRRSEPSSRSLLMGEQPHPWQLLHRQDRENRQRSSKPPGRYELLLETTQLSPG